MKKNFHMKCLRSILFILFFATFCFSQTAQELKDCPIFNLSPMMDNSSCTSSLLVSYQYSGFISNGGHRITMFTSDFNFSYFGISVGLLEFEKIEYLPGKEMYTSNFIFTVPAVLASVIETMAVNSPEADVIKVARKVFTIPSNVSNFRLHLYDPFRHVSIFSGLNSDIFLKSGSIGFISKSESGLRLKIGQVLFFTLEVIYGKVVFNTYNNADHKNFWGLAAGFWVDGW